MSHDDPQVTDIPPRPRTRGDCENGERPCPWVSCAHHLYLDVPPGGGLRLTHPDIEPWELQESCALDVADRGGLTLEEVSEVMNVTRERIRQIEELALHRLRRPASKALVDDLPAPRHPAPVAAPVRRLPVARSVAAAPPPAPVAAPRAEPVAPPAAPAGAEVARDVPPAPVAEPEPVAAAPAAIEPPARPAVRRRVCTTRPAASPAAPETAQRGPTSAELEAARIAEMRPLRPPTRKAAGDDWPLWERA